MRIAVLTSARSGSTSLFYFIMGHLDKKYKSISEPFNKYHWGVKDGADRFNINFFEENENIFIKTFVSTDQIPTSFTNNHDSYWEWFKGYFDKIILLDRKNKDLQSESLSYLINKDKSWNWQKKQYYDLSQVNEVQLHNIKEKLLHESELIHSMSNHYPLVYFEDIYIKKDKNVALDMLNYLNLELNEIFYKKYIESDSQRIRLTEDEVKLKNLI